MDRGEVIDALRSHIRRALNGVREYDDGHVAALLDLDELTSAMSGILESVEMVPDGAPAQTLKNVVRHEMDRAIKNRNWARMS